MLTFLERLQDVEVALCRTTTKSTHDVGRTFGQDQLPKRVASNLAPHLVVYEVKITFEFVLHELASDRHQILLHRNEGVYHIAKVVQNNFQIVRMSMFEIGSALVVHKLVESNLLLVKVGYRGKYVIGNQHRRAWVLTINGRKPKLEQQPRMTNVRSIKPIKWIITVAIYERNRKNFSEVRLGQHCGS
jgi:hypothetical protein